MIDSDGQKLAGEFFQNFANELGPVEPIAAAVVETPLAGTAAAAPSALETAAPAKGWFERLLAWFRALFGG